MKIEGFFLSFTQTFLLHYVYVYSRGLTTTTKWGDTILLLSESCLSSNPVGKTTKTSSSKRVILQMHSICFSFKDMKSVKIWRDEIKAAENLLFTPAVAKNGFLFWNCTGSQIRSHIPTLGIIWKFHVNITYAKVNPLCSCQPSVAFLIVGRRKLALPQSGMTFSVFSIFIFIYLLYLCRFRLFSLIFAWAYDRYWLSHANEQSIMPIN